MSAAQALHARWSLDAGEHEHVIFAVEGMHCAGCARTIETAVSALPGIEGVRVNAATARVSVDWRGKGATGLEQILGAVAKAGFKPVPLAGDAAAAEYQKERRTALKRVGLASLGMMQAMMYLSALYGFTDIDASMAQLMRIAGMVIVTPVLFYSGAPFFAGAWRDLRNRRLGMDVPVALALALAFIPSVINTFRASGEVYFDSVGMFVFFLSAGRFVEMMVRHRGLSSTEALARSLPSQVIRLREGQREKVPASEIAPGDRILVPKGGIIPVDAMIPRDVFVRARLDESLVSGESEAVEHGPGAKVHGGSLNLGEALTLVATAPASRSTLASMVALLERAQGERPRLARAADRAASWFVAVILALATLTAALWWQHDPARVLPAVLAVLVVSCPCALSLATPAALAAITAQLARWGVLVTRVDAIERLATVDVVVFDKTGTLTSGGTAINAVNLLNGLSRDEVLAIAATLERGSAHPLAAAFAPHGDAALEATGLREFTGEGIEATVKGSLWRLGRRSFAAGVATSRKVLPLTRESDTATVYLGGSHGIVASFEIGAPLRPQTREAVDALRALGVQAVIASGDNERATDAVARPLGIRRAHSRLTPDDKLWLVKELRSGGHRVFMVGDGINDGPVLAAADVSCAMGQGSAIAQSAADVLLVNENLALLPRAITGARAAMRVVRQNLGWSLAYNFIGVPLAALGLISPWLAALGMSLSSLGVVLNARRLSGGDHA